METHLDFNVKLMKICLYFCANHIYNDYCFSSSRKLYNEEGCYETTEEEEKYLQRQSCQHYLPQSS